MNIKVRKHCRYAGVPSLRRFLAPSRAGIFMCRVRNMKPANRYHIVICRGVRRRVLPLIPILIALGIGAFYAWVLVRWTDGWGT